MAHLSEGPDVTPHAPDLNQLAQGSGAPSPGLGSMGPSCGKGAESKFHEHLSLDPVDHLACDSQEDYALGKDTPRCWEGRMGPGSGHGALSL